MIVKKKSFKREISILIVLLVLITGFILLKLIDFKSAVGSDENKYISIDTTKESCLSCHDQKTGFSDFHNPENIGCASCHLGNGESFEKEISHNGMVLIPGNLSNAAETCGKCHVNELEKVQKSLMTTNSGIVAIDKFIFGEADSPNYHYHIKDIKATAAEKHLRDLCANCHLGAEKQEFGKIDQLSRGGGCIACHLNYSNEAEQDLQTYVSSQKETLPKAHPSTDIFVTNEHCFGCHSRSSRISTNYEGWQETLLNEEEITIGKDYRVLEDKRVYAFKGEDVHHAKGMLCIDCHSSHEVMGDGNTYLHEEDAVSLQCADCHYKTTPKTITYDELDTESSLVFMHRKYAHTDKKMLAVERDGHPLVNTFIDEDGEVYLIGKKDGKKHLIKKQSDVCSRDKAHQNMACSTCHSQWTSRCIGCHNSFDKNDTSGYDLLDKKEVIGKWSEYVYEFGASLPSLGVRTDVNHYKIEPAIPGMILTIDHQSFSENNNDKTSFHRLYAPNSPHTTSKEVRDCKSCHADPEAIGYGKGKLTYEITANEGEWKFDPEYSSNKNDNLPEDAWIPFLEESKAKVYSTRTNFRPFTVKEQKRILFIGACLQCHSDDSKQMQRTLTEGLDKTMRRLSESCILPKYD